MKRRKRGRPFKQDGEKQSQSLLVMVQAQEKAAFKDAAALAGASLSSWVRQRLRTAANNELAAASRAVAFLTPGGPEKIEPKRIIKVQVMKN
jgi:hypothetical protein